MVNKYSIFIMVSMLCAKVGLTRANFYISTSTEAVSELSVETNSSRLSSVNILNSSRSFDRRANILLNSSLSTNSTNITSSDSISFESDETTEGLSELAYYTGNSTEGITYELSATFLTQAFYNSNRIKICIPSVHYYRRI